jgi:MOSC domain-containing protein YiiM
MAKVIAINSSKAKGVVKEPIEQGYFNINHGLQGDAHAGNWHRQVSLLALESIEKMQKQGFPELKPGSFAENITTQGLCLYELPVGTKLKIGQTIMEVTQIGKECHMGCTIRQQTGDCIMPREGIFAKVIMPGWVKAEDELEIINLY